MAYKSQDIKSTRSLLAQGCSTARRCFFLRSPWRARNLQIPSRDHHGHACSDHSRPRASKSPRLLLPFRFIWAAGRKLRQRVSPVSWMRVRTDTSKDSILLSFVDWVSLCSNVQFIRKFLNVSDGWLTELPVIFVDERLSLRDAPTLNRAGDVHFKVRVSVLWVYITHEVSNGHTFPDLARSQLFHIHSLCKNCLKAKNFVLLQASSSNH